MYVIVIIFNLCRLQIHVNNGPTIQGFNVYVLYTKPAYWLATGNIACQHDANKKLAPNRLFPLAINEGITSRCHKLGLFIA